MIAGGYPATGLVLFHSEFGNTEAIARAIAAAFAERGDVQVARLGEIGPWDLRGVSWLILGVPTHYRGVPESVARHLRRIPAAGLAGVRVAVFDTRYRMPRWLGGSAARGLVRYVRRLGGRLVVPPESFFVVDREGPLHEGELDRASEWGRRLAATLEHSERERAAFDRGLYLRWIVANGWGELVGLGATAALLAWAAGAFREPASPLAVLGTALLAIAGGTAFEGVVVGYAQARALRPSVPALGGGQWVAATAIGAAVAWTLGMTWAALAGPPSGAEAPAWLQGPLQYALAAAMGLVLGPVLALPQARALRRHTRRPALWIPGNAVAWAVGMPIVFVGAGLVPAGAGLALWLAVIALTSLAAGLVVGALHGVVLVWLLEEARDSGSDHDRP